MLFSTVKYKYLAWIEGLRRAAQTVIIIFASHHRFLLRITAVPIFDLLRQTTIMTG